MNGLGKRSRVRLWTLIVAASLLTPAAAELAKVHLKNGTVMRGDVELSEAEAVIRNVAGVVRCPREQVGRIEWLEEAKTVRANYMRRFWVLPRDDVSGHFALAEWLVERRLFDPAREQCAYVLKLDPDREDARLLLQKVEQQSGKVAETQPVEGVTSQPTKAGLEPPPLLGPRDILKLKLSELALDGPPERLNVRFRKPRGERDLEDLVRRDMRATSDYDPDWDQTLDKGRTYEKLPIVLKATGLKYVDRIDLRGHPRIFTTYRRRVLPIVLKGCARSGCHGGRTAHAFCFPAGSRTSDEFVYTSFAILDSMQTAAGPMIDRDLPEDSALIRYMLPVEGEQQGHPPVKQSRVTPMLRGTRDPRYQMLVEWISSLRCPHPDYELEYTFHEFLD